MEYLQHRICSEKLLTNAKRCDYEYHVIEKMASKKRKPIILELEEFLRDVKYHVYSQASIKKNGRKWVSEHLRGKSKTVLNEFMDAIEKHNKSEKDAEKRYQWDIIALTRQEGSKVVRVEDAFILRVKLGPENGLFLGVIQGNWHLFY